MTSKMLNLDPRLLDINLLMAKSNPEMLVSDRKPRSVPSISLEIAQKEYSQRRFGFR